MEDLCRLDGAGRFCVGNPSYEGTGDQANHAFS